MTLSRLLLLAMPLASLPVLWAGATPPPHALPHLATAATPPDKAVVIVSVSHGADAGSGAAGTIVLDRATPQMMQLDTATWPGKPWITNDFSDAVGHVYVLEVAPGHHRFAVWCMKVRDRQGCSSVDMVPLAFDVAAGDVVYVGNLDIRLRMGQTWITHKEVATGAYAEVVDRSERDLAMASKRVPDIAGRVRISLLPLGPWRQLEAGHAASAP